MRQARRRSQDVNTHFHQTSSQPGNPTVASGVCGSQESKAILTFTTAQKTANRLASTQPTYDLLTGSTTAAPPPLNCVRRLAQVGRLDIDNEDLRAQINTLQYELDSLRQECDVTKLRYEKELRDAQAKADGDFKRAQVRARYMSYPD